MQINNSPVSTCQNYGINSFDLSKVDIKQKDKSFGGFSYQNLKINSFLTPCEKLLEQKDNLAYYFTVKEGVSKIDFDFDKSRNYLVESLIFSMPEDRESTLIIKYSGLKNAYHNGGLKFVCKKRSKLNVIIMVDSTGSTNLFDISCTLQQEAKCNFTIIDFSSKASVYKHLSTLKGDRSELSFNTIYFGEGESKIDLNYLSEISGKNCNTTINAVGALSGKSEKSFKGDIDFKRGAKKSKGVEKDFCLLLSRESKSRSMPMLLCTEEDVDGSHSSSTGKIDKNVLFYLMSRGFDRAEALKLYVKSSFASLLKNVPEEIKNSVEQTIDRKIENEEL